ncbi:hypothetical protein KIPB_009477, partial [Kipferlia bialata]
ARLDPVSAEYAEILKHLVAPCFDILSLSLSLCDATGEHIQHAMALLQLVARLPGSVGQPLLRPGVMSLLTRPSRDKERVRDKAIMRERDAMLERERQRDAETDAEHCTDRDKERERDRERDQRERDIDAYGGGVVDRMREREAAGCDGRENEWYDTAVLSLPLPLLAQLMPVIRTAFREIYGAQGSGTEDLLLSLSSAMGEGTPHSAYALHMASLVVMACPVDRFAPELYLLAKSVGSNVTAYTESIRAGTLPLPSVVYIEGALVLFRTLYVRLPKRNLATYLPITVSLAHMAAVLARTCAQDMPLHSLVLTDLLAKLADVLTLFGGENINFVSWALVRDLSLCSDSGRIVSHSDSE